MSSDSKKEHVFSDTTLFIIQESIDTAINSIADFKFPYLTHVHDDEQITRLKELTMHLRDKCDSYLEMIESNM
jgi:hypothetical protein